MDNKPLDAVSQAFPLQPGEGVPSEPTVIRTMEDIARDKARPARRRLDAMTLGALTAGLASSVLFHQPKPRYGKKGGLVTAATFKPKKKFRKKKGK